PPKPPVAPSTSTVRSPAIADVLSRYVDGRIMRFAPLKWNCRKPWVRHTLLYDYFNQLGPVPLVPGRARSRFAVGRCPRARDRTADGRQARGRARTVARPAAVHALAARPRTDRGCTGAARLRAGDE